MKRAVGRRIGDEMPHARIAYTVTDASMHVVRMLHCIESYANLYIDIVSDAKRKEIE